MTLTRPLSSVLARMLTALVTVWCLGCSGFQPLLSALFGGQSSMQCGAGMTVSQGGGPSAGVASGSAIHETSAARALDCGCGTCASSTPHDLRIAAARTDVPTVATLQLIAPASITRAPLAPPPQARA